MKISFEHQSQDGTKTTGLLMSNDSEDLVRRQLETDPFCYSSQIYRLFLDHDIKEITVQDGAGRVSTYKVVEE